MKIDLPVTILLDCQGTDPRNLNQAAQKIVGTIRYETDPPADQLGINGVGDALFFPKYPPPDDADTKYWENVDGLMAHLSHDADKKIKKRAARSPYDYMVGTEQERTIAQEEADEQAAQDGQFGAGA